MTAQMKTNASAKKAVKSPSHIFDTFIVGAGISGIAAAIRLDQVVIPIIRLLKKLAVLVEHGVKIPIQVVVVMYLLLFTLIHLHQVRNGAIYLHANQKS